MVATRPRGLILIVEGGGHHNPSLETDCRRAFTKLMENAGLRGRLPRTIAAGNRKSAYNEFVEQWKRFQKGIGPLPVLLVDSEAPVTAASPWTHVREREGDTWDCPNGAEDDHLHLMVECMEAWLIADRAALREFFGSDLKENALPAEAAKIESIPKVDLYKALEHATHKTKKGKYGKGTHSFKLLATVDVTKLRGDATPWAKRFFATIDRLSRPGAA